MRSAAERISCRRLPREAASVFLHRPSRGALRVVTMLKRALSVLLCLTLLFAGAVPAYAEGEDDAAKAKEHFIQGQALYKEGKYREAIEELKRAYALKPAPGLLLNIAHTYRKIDDKATALDYYKRYLEFAPNAKNADQIKAIIAELEGKKPEAGGTATPAPVVAPPAELPASEEGDNPLAAVKRRTTEVKSSPYRVWKWVTLGVGVGLLGGGVATAVIAKQKQDSLEKAASDSTTLGGCTVMANPCPPAAIRPASSFDMYRSLESDGKTMATASGVLFGIGGAVLATSVILFILDARSSKVEEEPKKKTTSSNTSWELHPVLGGTMGLAGSVQF
jgi:hypothetical protein